VVKILLVEDNEDNRDMLIRRLQRRGFEVVWAVDGAQGVSLAGSDMPDLILMDMGLPVLDGWAATAQIKASPQTRSIPIIGLSANAMSGDREKGIAAGCNDYDTKPVEFARLLEKIQALLPKEANPAASASSTPPLKGEA
jgi:two-component system cell cycle response regulator DivK